MSAEAAQLTALSLCMTLERLDATGFAVTSHDQRLRINDEWFEPDPGLMPNSVQIGDEDSPGLELTGSLQSGLLSEFDLKVGRWDGARLSISAADWEHSHTVASLTTGQLGEVTTRDGTYTADVLGNSAKLRRPICPAISPECRAALGDKACRVDLSLLQTRAEIIQVTGPWLKVDKEAGEAFRFGSIRFLSGPLCGLSEMIVDASESSIRLRDALELSPAPGTKVTLTQGCDKRPETCRDRFANMVNFRGEPQVPGTDYLLRFPGS